MIEIRMMEMDSERGIYRRLSARGHAGYAPPGQDIVCAAVSGILEMLAAWVREDKRLCARRVEAESGRMLIEAGAKPKHGRAVDERFDLVGRGLAALAKQWPEYISYHTDGRKEQEKTV